MMLRFLCALCFLAALSALAANESASPTPYDSVYRIQASGHGRVADGSAVLIAPGRLLTSCHVTRQAKSIRVGREQLQWNAQLTKADIARDLCILRVTELAGGMPATIGASEMLRLGEPVLAVGYPRGGKMDASRGEIKGLHAHDGAHVIQVSAHFDHGQSGGGVFDATGRLIGIIGFKALAGGDFHYALPLTWAGEAVPGQSAFADRKDQAEHAFWQRQFARKPLFLQAAALEANRDWPALIKVAQEWVDADQHNPAAWRCLGRILARLKHDQAAAGAYAQAEALLSLVPGALSKHTPLPLITVAELDLPASTSDRPARQ